MSAEVEVDLDDDEDVPCQCESSTSSEIHDHRAATACPRCVVTRIEYESDEKMEVMNDEDLDDFVYENLGKCHAIDIVHGYQRLCSNKAKQCQGDEEVFCVEHISALHRHLMCAHCTLFCSKGVFYCCDSGHRSHIACSDHLSKGLCSHCLSTATAAVCNGDTKNNKTAHSVVTSLEELLRWRCQSSIFYPLLAKYVNYSGNVLSEATEIELLMRLCGDGESAEDARCVALLFSLPYFMAHAEDDSRASQNARREVARISMHAENTELLCVLLSAGVAANWTFFLDENYGLLSDVSFWKSLRWLSYNSSTLGLNCSEIPDDLREKSVEALVKTREMGNCPEETISFLHRLSSSKKLVDSSVVEADLSGGCERFPLRVVNNTGETAAFPKFKYGTRVLDVLRVLPHPVEADVLGKCGDDCFCVSFSYTRNEDYESIALGNPHAYDMSRQSERIVWPIRECSAACNCSLNCGNRLAQKGATHAVEIFRTSNNRGWGVRARQLIPQGAFICEYAGELLTEEVADSREDEVYLFETTVGGEKYTIDAKRYGNFARFFNHSCDPNAVALVSWAPCPESELAHVCIYAQKDVLPGQEITISYGRSWWTGAKGKLHEFHCRCGSEQCEFDKKAQEKFLRGELNL